MFISAGVFSTLLHFFRPALDKRNKKQTNITKDMSVNTIYTTFCPIALFHPSNGCICCDNYDLYAKTKVYSQSVFNERHMFLVLKSRIY